MKKEQKLQLDDLRKTGKTIVFTNGCFDIIHAGHVRYLNQARREGDFLVLGLNSDDSIRRLKGESRPINKLEDRIEVLQGLRSVDMVLPFSEDTPLELIKTVKPDVLVKGADWSPEEVVGREEVEEYGGKLVLMPLLKGRSTTGIIESVREEKTELSGKQKDSGALCDVINDNVAVIIPARYASTRFPGKPLVNIDGKPMIAHVVEKALSARIPKRVMVATDDERIADEVRKAGGEAVLTSEDCNTGTDRVAEAASSIKDCRVIINLQGDEPLIDPDVIDKLAEEMLKNSDLPMATLAVPFENDDPALFDNSTAKIVTDINGNALYFSRSVIPYERDSKNCSRRLRHIGIYAFDRDFLQKFTKLPPTPAEKAESLEQLRALEHDFKVKVIEVSYSGVGVDHPEDVKKIENLLKSS